MDSDFAEKEINAVISSLHNNKVPGNDCFPAEFLKCIKAVLVSKFVILCYQILRDGKLPETWTQSNIITIHKPKILPPLNHIAQ